MNIYEINFDELLVKDFKYCSDENFKNEETLTDLIKQADNIINNNNETPIKRAEAYNWKFQLLLYRRQLAPNLLYKALEIIPEMPQSLVRLSNFYYHKEIKHNKNDVLDILNRIIANNPEYPYSLLIRASFLDDKENSLSDCRKFIELMPNNIMGYENALNYISKLIRDLDNNDKEPSDELIDYIDESINYLDRLININSSKIKYYLDRAELIIKKENKLTLENNTHKALSDIIYYFTNCEYNLYDIDIDFNHLFNNIRKKIRKSYYKELIKNVSVDNNIYWFANLALANIKYEKGHFKKAIKYYSEIINNNIEGNVFKILALKGRAEVYDSKDEYDLTLNDYNDMIVNSKQLLKDFNNYNDFENKVPSDINISHIHFQRALIYHVKDTNDDNEKLINIKNEINEYTQAIEYSENKYDEYYLYQRAELYEEIKEHDKAINDYTIIIDYSLKNKETSYMLDAYIARMDIYFNTKKIFKYIINLFNYSKVKKYNKKYYLCLDNLLSKLEPFKIIGE